MIHTPFLRKKWRQWTSGIFARFEIGDNASSFSNIVSRHNHCGWRQIWTHCWSASPTNTCASSYPAESCYGTMPSSGWGWLMFCSDPAPCSKQLVLPSPDFFVAELSVFFVSLFFRAPHFQFFWGESKYSSGLLCLTSSTSLCGT